MTALSKFGTSTRASVLMAALALGATLLSLTPSQTALAAVATPGADEVDAGDSGSSSAAREKPKPKDNGERCTTTKSDGTIVFHLPGSIIKTVGLGKLKCGTDGKWHQVRVAVPSENEAPSGGVYQPVP